MNRVDLDRASNESGPTIARDQNPGVPPFARAQPELGFVLGFEAFDARDHLCGHRVVKRFRCSEHEPKTITADHKGRDRKGQERVRAISEARSQLDECEVAVRSSEGHVENLR